MPSEFRIVRRVEFAETDMAGIMHFSNYFRWMEVCETAFFRSLKLPQIALSPARIVAWPRIKAECDYRAPLRFGDEVEVRLLVRELRTRAVVFDFQFRKLRRGQPETDLAASGRVVAVCVRSDPKTGRMAATPIPPRVRKHLQVAAVEP